MMKLMRLNLIIIILIIIASCVKSHIKWSHPNSSKSQWRIDKINCASEANKLAEKNLKYNRLNINDSSIQNKESLFVIMDVYDAKRQRQNFFYTCLKKLGYTKLNIE